MYTRESNTYRDTVPDNYNGTVMMGHCDDRRDTPKRVCENPHAQKPTHEHVESSPHRPSESTQCNEKMPYDDRCPPSCEVSCETRREPRCEQQNPHKKDSGIFSSLLGKLGLDGIDTTELVLLFAALLLMGNGEDCDDNYIWVILLLLLIIK